MSRRLGVCLFPVICLLVNVSAPAAGFQPPNDKGTTVRRDVFAFAGKPSVKLVGKDKYEISFSVEDHCDVAVDLIDGKGIVVRHIGAGVLGANAPAPFRKGSLEQKIVWNGKDDLGRYVKEPLKMKVRVRLGLKPVFDKRLGGADGRNIPGYVFGIAVGPDGGYVFTKGYGSHGHVAIRKYGRDGEYLSSLVPPPAAMPHSKLNGLQFVEYEEGKRAVHGVNRHETIARDGYFLPGVNGKGIADCQVALHGNRIYFANSGSNLLVGRVHSSKLFYIGTDGSTDIAGMMGKPMAWAEHMHPRLAVSPDGKTVYMVGVGEKNCPCVVAVSTEGKKGGRVFAGAKGPGSDDTHLNGAVGIDCDAKGRVYVADYSNNRVQVFSPEGKCLKTIRADRASLVRVHGKTGAIYVLHGARRQGKSIGRMTKFRSFDNPAEEFHHDDITAVSFALDSWSPKPRLWTAGKTAWTNTAGTGVKGPSVRIWEEQGKKLVKICDFDEEARKEAGGNYMGRWNGVGACGDKVICDPTRERVYYQNRHIFELATGKYLGKFKTNHYKVDDLAFCKRGYLHGHANPGFDYPGVWRVDPERGTSLKDRRGNPSGVTYYPEVPYDYGVESKGKFSGGWVGIIPVKDQQGAKYFQDGFGVNMAGDIAEECNIYYVPRMEEVGHSLLNAGGAFNRRNQVYGGGIGYEDWIRKVQDRQKRGEDVYFIKRRPGISLAGATVWTFDRTGELRDECAVIAGRLLSGVHIDEDGYLYFLHNRPRVVDGRRYLADRVGTFGSPKFKASPFTGTFIKGKAPIRVLLARAPVRMEPVPDRPADVLDTGGFADPKGNRGWVEGALWMYAGGSPIVAGGCSCPKSRFHLDWYKRSFVPEAYRHSLAVLDTNGNLIMHLGRYGNHDDAGAMKPGDTDIPMFMARFIGGTDNYLVFEDWGERLVVLKLDYHAGETASVKR
jgi:hypothetical protein